MDRATNPPARSAWIALPILLCLGILATFPGWLPRRVYLPASELVRQSPSMTIQLAAEQIRHGQMPLWNPSIGLGEPLLEKGNIGVLAPTILPHLLLKPTWTWTLSAALRLTLAGIGFWMLAGRHGMRNAPRLFAAAIFMLAAFDIAHLDPSLLNLLPWLPWCILSLEWMIDRPALWRIALTAMIFAGQFLAGDLIASICLLSTCAAALLLNLVRFRPTRTLIALPAILLAMALGLALAGAQWWPLWVFARRNGWPAPAGSLQWVIARMWSLPLLMLAILVIGWIGRPWNLTGIRRWLPAGAVAALIALAILRDRGISTVEYESARTRMAQNAAMPLLPHRPNMPPAWGAPKSQWFANAADLNAKLSDVSFDPASAVLLDDDVPPDTLEWIEQSFPQRHDSKPAAKSFWSVTPKVDGFERSGNRMVVRATLRGMGWIVVGGAYADGWSARSKAAGPFAQYAISHEELVVPAYGKLLAAQVSGSGPTDITLEYWPASFRRGLLITSATAVVLILLACVSLARRPFSV